LPKQTERTLIIEYDATWVQRAVTTLLRGAKQIRVHGLKRSKHFKYNPDLQLRCEPLSEFVTQARKRQADSSARLVYWSLADDAARVYRHQLHRLAIGFQRPHRVRWLLAIAGAGCRRRHD
jgi:hypothetical protein